MILAAARMDPQIPLLVAGGALALIGVILACFCLLCIGGKIKPNTYAGVRFYVYDLHRLNDPEKYWYEVNRYGGKKLISVSIAWILVGVFVVVLPLGPGIKAGFLIIATVLIFIMLLLTVRQISRYADELIARDKQYIRKA